MSQHHYFVMHSGEMTHVLMGWDKPLQYFFMVIEKESDLEEPFWSNLNCDSPFQKNLIYYRQVLDELQIVIPGEMLEEIERDAMSNIGNKEVTHRFLNGVHYRVQND